MSGVVNEDVVKMLRRHMELRTARDEAKAAAEKAETEYRDSEADLYDLLQSPSTVVKGALKLDLGEPWGTVSFSPRSTTFGRVLSEKDALAHFRSRHILGEVSTPKLSMKRINEIVRDCEEQGKPCPPGLDWTKRRGVTITRQKS